MTNTRLSRRSLAAALLAALTAVALIATPATASGPKGSATFKVTTTLDTTDVAPGNGRCADANGECSLRAAVQEANASGGAGRIELQKGETYALTIGGAAEDLAATGDLDVTGYLTIEGKDAVIDLGGLGDRGFDVTAGARLEVERVTVRNGAPPATESGGAFRSAGMLLLERVTAHHNTVAGPGASGGAVINLGGVLRVERSEFHDNTATRAGGAIEANAGTTTIERSVFTANATGAAPGNGGAFHLTGPGFVSVSRSTVVGNTAAAEGGGLWNSASGEMIVERSTFRDNAANGTDATQGGGALFNDGGSLTVERSHIEGNVARSGSGSGGGILNDGGLLSVVRTTLAGNEAARAGGGIETNAGVVTIERSEFDENVTGSAPGNGGALHVSGAATVDITRTGVEDNFAANEGGGLWNSPTGTLTVTDSDIEGNSVGVPGNGPNVFQKGPVGGGTFTVDGLVVPEGPNTLSFG